MTIDHSAHRVMKVTITSEQRFQSSGRERVARDILIEFADGTSQVISLYADEAVNNLTVEIK